MRDLDLALSDRHEAVAGQHRQNLGDALVASTSSSASSTRGVPPLALALARQPQQDPPSDLLLSRLEPRVSVLGEPRDRAVHAARLLVGAHAQPPAVATLPELEQRGGQQR